MVVMIPICVVNGMAALITFGYVFVFWKGWCSRCKQDGLCWVAKDATEAAVDTAGAVAAEITKTVSSTEVRSLARLCTTRILTHTRARVLPTRSGDPAENLRGPRPSISSRSAWSDPSILRRLRMGRRRRTSPTPLRRRSQARARRRRSLPPRAVRRRPCPGLRQRRPSLV